MARVLGIGGVFFKSKDPGTLTSWYRSGSSWSDRSKGRIGRPNWAS